MQNQKFDILVSFQIHQSESASNKAFESLDLNLNPQYEINWAIYDINLVKVIDDARIFTSKDMSLQKFFQDFNLNLFTKFVGSNQKFCFITSDDYQFQVLLGNYALSNKIQLPHSYYWYFNIVDEYKKFKGGNQDLNNLQEILKQLNLSDIPSDSQGQVIFQQQWNCRTILRLVNIFTQNGYVFQNPKYLSVERQILQTVIQKSPNYLNSPLLPSLLLDDKNHQDFYLRLRGLPFNIQDHQIEDFFRMVYYDKKNLILKYQEDGKFSGECFLKVSSKDEVQDIKRLNLGRIGHRYIEILDSNESEYLNAKNSLMSGIMPGIIPSKIEIFQDSQDMIESQGNERGVIRCRGLPYHTGEKEIEAFFQDFKICPEGIKIVYQRDGKHSGQAFVVFENQAEAKRALKMDGESIGSRYIELFVSNIKEMMGTGNQQCQNNFKPQSRGFQQNELSNNLGYQKLNTRTLKTMGWPFRISIQDVHNFFAPFRLRDSDIDFEYQRDGRYIFIARFSGIVYVTFMNENEASKAYSKKNKQYIGNRFVEIVPYDQSVILVIIDGQREFQLLRSGRDTIYN